MLTKSEQMVFILKGQFSNEEHLFFIFVFKQLKCYLLHPFQCIYHPNGWFLQIHEKLFPIKEANGKIHIDFTSMQLLFACAVEWKCTTA